MTRILIIRAGALGDFVLTLPLFEALRAAEPKAEIVILGYPHVAELAVGRRHASEVRRVDGAEWAPLFARGGRLGHEEADWLRSFDRVIAVWPDHDGVLRENLMQTGARELVCVDPMPPEGKGVHAVEHLAAQCARAGIELPWLDPQVYLTERDRAWAQRFMRMTVLDERPILAVNPGSGSRRKNWPAERFAEVARTWMRRRAGHVLLFIGPADEEQAAAFAGAMAGEAFVSFQEESLVWVAAMLERCAAFVGNDSGITHLAAAVRTPVAAVFGPTDPRLWRPRAPRARVAAPAAPGEIASVTSADVLRALEDALAPQ